MTCQRCGTEYVNATEKMRENNLCILCIMEWHRKGKEVSLIEFAKTRRGSHFKL